MSWVHPSSGRAANVGCCHTCATGRCTARDDDSELINEWLTHLQQQELDYTLSFRQLAARAVADNESSFGEFETRWRQRINEQDIKTADIPELMNAVNPLFIPRNHRVEQAISEAVAGDLTVFNDLNTVLAQPFDEQPGFKHYAEAPQRHERVTQTFCGT